MADRPQSTTGAASGFDGSFATRMRGSALKFQ